MRGRAVSRSNGVTGAGGLLRSRLLVVRYKADPGNETQPADDRQATPAASCSVAIAGTVSHHHTFA